MTYKSIIINQKCLQIHDTYAFLCKSLLSICTLNENIRISLLIDRIGPDSRVNISCTCSSDRHFPTVHPSIQYKRVICISSIPALTSTISNHTQMHCLSPFNCTTPILNRTRFISYLHWLQVNWSFVVVMDVGCIHSIELYKNTFRIVYAVVVCDKDYFNGNSIF